MGNRFYLISCWVWAAVRCAPMIIHTLKSHLYSSRTSTCVCTSNSISACADEGFGVGHTRYAALWLPGMLPLRLGLALQQGSLLLSCCEAAWHRRNTQTKGVWLWGEPDLVPADSGGVATAIIYVDTEGFESTGKSDAYDDRIFALSAVISSLLVRISSSNACFCHHLPFSCAHTRRS